MKIITKSAFLAALGLVLVDAAGAQGIGPEYEAAVRREAAAIVKALPRHIGRCWGDCPVDLRRLRRIHFHWTDEGKTVVSKTLFGEAFFEYADAEASLKAARRESRTKAAVASGLEKLRGDAKDLSQAKADAEAAEAALARAQLHRDAMVQAMIALGYLDKNGARLYSPLGPSMNYDYEMYKPR